MRPFEWLFLLSLLPALLLPHFPHARRHHWWIIGAALLPLIAATLHLTLEGWRTQMIPLFALAAIVIAMRLFALRGTNAARRKPNTLASTALILAFVGGGLLPGWLLPVFDLPDPTGPYHVGIVNRELVDTARGRRLMVSIWYPAAQSSPPARLTDHPDALAHGLASAFGVPVAAPALQHLGYVRLAASEGVAVATNAAPFPVLVFSHGMTGSRIQNSPAMQELASWGYVVVALDHTDAAAVTVFPDGETRLFDLGRFGVDLADVDSSGAILLPVWVADQRVVYDAIEAWAADDPLLAGKLDLQQIGSFGHSFGGATALVVCRVDPRCRAAANLDGGVSHGPAVAATRPLLLMTSTASREIAEANQHWSRLLEAAEGPAYWLELPGSNHLSFTILPLISPLLGPFGADAGASLRTVDKYVRAFFDLHLTGQPTPLLDPNAGETDIHWLATR